MVRQFLVDLNDLLLRSVGSECPAVQEIIIELYLIGLVVFLNGQLPVNLAEVAVLATSEEQLNSSILDHVKRAQFC